MNLRSNRGEKIGIHAILPYYKREEYLWMCLDSLYKGSEGVLLDVFLHEDGPATLPMTRIKKYPRLRYFSGDHVGISLNLARTIQKSLMASELSIRFLVASDHLFPRGWGPAILNAARIALSEGMELGLFEHTPGPIESQEEWKKQAQEICENYSIARINRPIRICSMPSVIVGKNPAIGVVAALSRNFVSSSESEAVSRKYIKYWEFRMKKTKKPLFCILGRSIEHIGKPGGGSPHFISSPEHMKYYREMKQDWRFNVKKC